VADEVQLLSGPHDAFDDRKVISTRNYLPISTPGTSRHWRRRKGLNPRDLFSMLCLIEIRPRTVRLGERTAKRYTQTRAVSVASSRAFVESC
jgi:hypothetical protein